MRWGSLSSIRRAGCLVSGFSSAVQTAANGENLGENTLREEGIPFWLIAAEYLDGSDLSRFEAKCISTSSHSGEPCCSKSSTILSHMFPVKCPTLNNRDRMVEIWSTLLLISLHVRAFWARVRSKQAIRVAGQVIRGVEVDRLTQRFSRSEGGRMRLERESVPCSSQHSLGNLGLTGLPFIAELRP